MKRVVVLGGGMVGGFMARELSRDPRFDVLVCDRDEQALDRSVRTGRLKTRNLDLSVPAAIREVVAPADIVIGAVPGHMGFQTAQAVLEVGKPLVDISFFPEDPFQLDRLARTRGVTAVVDCGVMPGLGGMLGIHLAAQFDRAERVVILVGGLPVERRWPMEYRAPFSPIDVIEEYTRPARIKLGGEVVVRPALSDPELVDFPGVGTLEAFNTDGLRTLLTTCDAPNMQEKTLRYPGHVERMRMLRELGFFSSAPVDLGGGKEVRPLDVTAKLLFGAWRLEPGMAEMTVMRVEVEGVKGARREIRRCDLVDRTDPETGDTSMARTTGYPAVIVAKLIAEEATLPAGVVPAETLARDEALFRRILTELERVRVTLEFETC